MKLIKFTFLLLLLIFPTLSTAEAIEKLGNCYWKENMTGRHEWIPAEIFFSLRKLYSRNKPVKKINKDKCYKLDSCYGGLGYSGGGCYKWALSAEGKREKWKAISKKSIVTNLVTNGSFEQPSFDYGWKNFSSIPGWTARVGQIEVQHGIAGKPQHMEQLVELDANSSSSIYQDIDTKVGNKYVLKFYFSARPGTNFYDNKLQVLWGGRVLDTLNAGSGKNSTDWKEHMYTVVADSNKMRLEFADIGRSNGLGTYIDNVFLKLKP